MKLVLLAAILALAGCSDDLSPPYEAISDAVNQSIIYQPQKATEGLPCPVRGNCQDFAICKARVLMRGGVDASRLSMLVCNRGKWSTSIPHAILVVDGKIRMDVDDTHTPCEPIYSCNLKTGVATIGGVKLTAPVATCTNAVTEIREAVSAQKY